MAKKTLSLTTEPRSLTGTANSRRLRMTGKVPATLYGLGQDTASVSLAGEVLTPIVVAGSRIVDVDHEGSVTKAIIRDIQWDTFLTHLLHVDLQRLDADARVDLELSIEIRGAVNEGVLEQPLRTVGVNCPVFLVPDNPSVRVGSLKIGDSITVSDLEFPKEVTVSLDLDTVVVRVIEPVELDIEEEDVAAAIEPELIGRPADEEEGAEST